MKVEHQIATPQGDQTPHQRYARLHRAVESGLASDEVRSELVRICVELGHHGEAIRHYRQLHSSAARQSVGYFLARKGLIQEQSRPQSDPRRPALADHPGSAGDHLREGFAFLFQEQMPLTVIFATATFPVVAGLGGALTVGSPGWLLPLIALIPGLSVIAVVSAVARRGLVEASRGLHDPPAIPGLRTLGRESTRFLRDLGALTACMLGPGLAAILVLSHLGILGLEATLGCAAALAIGALALPMALLLRSLESGWRSLSPLRLLTAAWRTRRQYPLVAASSVVLFAPAAAVLWSTMGHAAWLQVAVTGPLLVVPLLVATRMLGSFADAQRVQLAPVITVRGVRPVAEGAVRVRDAVAERHRQQAAMGTRQVPPQTGRQRAQRAPGERMAQQLNSERGAVRQERPAAGQKPQRQGQRPQARPAAPATPRRTTAAGPVANQGGVHRQAARKQPAHPASGGPATGNPAAAQRPTSSARHKVSVDVVAGLTGGQDIHQMGPDLTHLPGATVVSGEDRQRLGASRRK